MPAFWIARSHITDPATYKKYTDRVPEIVGRYGGKILARGGRHQIMAGPETFERYVVMSLLCLYGIDLGIRTEKFCDVSRFVLDLAKVSVPPNRPIVGDKLYEVESGIIAGWVRLARKDNPLEFVPFAPELVGQKPVSIVLGKNSGPPSIEEWCEKLGVKATEEERMAMLQQVKAKSFEKKDLLTPDEFREIVDRVLQKASRSPALA